MTLGVITSLGGGISRDLIVGSVPPAPFQDWRYLLVASAGGLVAFALRQRRDRLAGPYQCSTR